jgi:hypothetical protein
MIGGFGVKFGALRSCRNVLMVAISSAASMCLAAKNYNPAWGPAPPAPPHGMQPLPKQRVIEHLIFPVIGTSRWSDDYSVDRGGFLHAAIDIKAPKMSPIVAPFSGTLGLKSESFWIYGDDGWTMLGTHLNNDNLGTHDKAGCRDVMFAPNLVGGQHVYAGQFIGYVGMSGNASGPHLHFELYAPGENSTVERVRDPFPSLKVAQFLSKPRLQLSGRGPNPGEIRLDGCVRRLDPKHRLMTLIVFGKTMANGHSYEVLGPRYIRFRLPDSVLAHVGGWTLLQTLPDSTPISCYLSASGKLSDATLSGVSIDSRALSFHKKHRKHSRRHSKAHNKPTGASAQPGTAPPSNANPVDRTDWPWQEKAPAVGSLPEPIREYFRRTLPTPN